MIYHSGKWVSRGFSGDNFFLWKVGPRERPSQGDEAWKTLHELFAGHDGCAWEINFQSMVFETRRKPGPTKAKRYGGRS